MPHYLPAWSSRAQSAAAFELGDGGLRLFVPPEMGRWCAATHDGALRVSGIQSGNRSGPVGSNDGQQRFRDDLVVTEAQPTTRGWLPSAGRVEITCRMTLSPRSMAAMWLSGFEERADEGGELCVVEIFGRSVDGASAAVGVGVKALYDPRLDRRLRRPEAADRHHRPAHLRSRVGRWHVVVLRRRRDRAPVAAVADVPDAGDGGCLRLPGLVDRRRRRADSRARGALDRRRNGRGTFQRRVTHVVRCRGEQPGRKRFSRCNVRHCTVADTTWSASVRQPRPRKYWLAPQRSRPVGDVLLPICCILVAIMTSG